LSDRRTRSLSRWAAAAWADRRNAAAKRIDRQFTTDDARIKLRRLYPAFEV